MHDRPPFLMLSLLAVITGGFLAGSFWLFGWAGVFLISALLLMGYNAPNAYRAFTGAEVTQSARNPFFRGLGDKPGDIPTWAKQMVQEEDTARHGQTPRRGREAWLINGALIALAVVSFLLSD